MLVIMLISNLAFTYDEISELYDYVMLNYFT